MYRLARRMSLFLGVLFLLSMIVNSQALMAGQPKIEFSEKDFFFGYIPADQIGRHDYWIGNGGDAALEITEIKPTCSCTEFAISSKVVEPGDSARLAVYFNAERMFKRVVKILIITSNDPLNPVDTIKFAAIVDREHPLVKVEPQHLELDAATLKGDNPVKSFSVANSSDKVVELELVGGQPQAFEATLSSDKIPPGGTARVDLRLKEYPELPGIVKNSITLRFVVGDGYRVTVPFTAEFAPLSP